MILIAAAPVFRGLPILQRDTCVPGLDEPSPSTPRVEVLFRSSRGGWPIARIAGELMREGCCPPLLFSLRGHHERSLDEGWLVFQELLEPIERLRRALERRSTTSSTAASDRRLRPHRAVHLRRSTSTPPEL